MVGLYTINSVWSKTVADIISRSIVNSNSMSVYRFTPYFTDEISYLSQVFSLSSANPLLIPNEQSLSFPYLGSLEFKAISKQ